MRSHSPIAKQSGTTRPGFRESKPVSFFSPVIQPKLTINQPGDAYEQEADAVAERVMRMPDTKAESPFFQPKPLPVTSIQRQCAGCEKDELQRKENEEEDGPVQLKPVKSFDIQRKCAACEEEEKLQLKETSTAAGGMTAPSIVSNVINSGAQLLDKGTRNFMESKFGYDFSNVQIHNDQRAHQSSKEINALAYTHGNHVVFGAGQYQPHTNSGKQLLAHELTHVVQQNKGGKAIQRRNGEQAGTTLHGAVRKIPADLSCNASTANISGGFPIGFNQNSFAITPAASVSIEQFKTDWNNAGASAPVTLDGYASIEGSQELNWRLSCSRALEVYRQLTTGFNAIAPRYIQFAAHGETNRFSRARHEPNRIVTISSTVPITPPRPGPTLLKRNFRAASWSFLSCALCNPFTDDGTLGMSPPATEPSKSSTHRQMHSMNVSVGTPDGIHIAPGSQSVVPDNDAHDSGYCNLTYPAAVINYVTPGSPRLVVSPSGIEGIEYQSEMHSRVGAIVPATLPGMPCGNLGGNNMIPVIGNRFKVVLYADNTHETTFITASLYPSHFLYENGALKMYGSRPVHPQTNFYAWSLSVAQPQLPSWIPLGLPLAAGLIYMFALRYACCNRYVVSQLCPTACAGGFSVPTQITPSALYGCYTLGKQVLSCPQSCAPAGNSCTPLVLPSNP